MEDHLSALREVGKISTWHDLELEAGTEWEPAILNKLDTADIILLLVSRNFIASKYCYGTELKWAIARHEAGTHFGLYFKAGSVTGKQFLPTTVSASAGDEVFPP
ncbi:MAG: TIR domain-containing protein [Leptolyngbyaceae cyanobacterium]